MTIRTHLRGNGPGGVGSRQSSVSPKTVLETLLYPSQPTTPGSGSSAIVKEVGIGRARCDENAAEAWDLLGAGHNYRADSEGAEFGAADRDAVPDAERALESSEAYELLYKALATLSKQEREILSRYFDLIENPDIDRPNTCGGESLTKIARAIGISKQRASELKRRALVKLRKAPGKPAR